MKAQRRNYKLPIAMIAVAFAILIGSSSISVPAQKLFSAEPIRTAATTETPFPRTYQLTGGTATLYTPQLASWDDQKRAVIWAAVSYKPTSAEKPAMGVIKAEADTQVALEERLVNFGQLRITEINFPSLSREDAQKLSTELQQAIVTGDRTMSLDRVLAALDKSQLVPKTSGSNGLKADPPKIYYSSKPAILVNFDGEPIFSPIQGTDLKFVVNTNWDVFEHTATKIYYLRDDTTWLKADAVTGPWTLAETLPDSFAKLPDDDNWKGVKESASGKLAGKTVPVVYVSKEPAELIATKGTPTFTVVTGTTLLWLNNTESDVFTDRSTGKYYYLVAGRWFSAPSLDGPWTFATPDLPADFKKIAVEHPRSRVLASVPGTDQAIEAVLIASIPQTARVNRKELKAPQVVYQGEPQFVAIENTSLERAVNTDKDIIRYQDSYYMCFQGVWFHSTSPNGPWAVAETIPAEIYKIPPSSSLYHTTFVKLVDDENKNDEWETFEAESGYVGMMVGWGCAVWGSGWYYPPYYWYGGYYPWYVWYPRTYGFSAWYNPYTGTYGRGAAVYGPYGGAGAFAAYNPISGTYARGGAIYGPYGSRGFAQAWNPRTGTYAQTRQGRSVYGNWGSSYVQRGDDWVRTAHVTNNATGNRTTGIRTSEGGGMVTRKTDSGRTTIGRTQGGDVYAGRDGNVYRKQNGEWQKWDNGSWNPAERNEAKRNIDSSTFKQLDRDNKSRVEGNRRTRDSSNYNLNRGGRSSAGSYRSGGFGGMSRGGGFRGGGGRRR